jgi:hypothetical protein
LRSRIEHWLDFWWLHELAALTVTKILTLAQNKSPVVTEEKASGNKAWDWRWTHMTDS